MHNNYYLFRLLSAELDDILAGYEFKECFSQNKDELIIGLSNGEKEFYIKADLSPQFCCLSFPETFHRAKRNSVDLFKNIIDQSVQSVEVVTNDRSFFINLEGDVKLLFKMHGNRSNILLIENDAVREIFKKSLKKDKYVSVEQLAKSLTADREAFEQSGGRISAFLPTGGPLFRRYLGEKCYDDLDQQGKWSLISNTIDLLQNRKQIDVINIEDQTFLSLIPFGEHIESYNSAIKALNAFYNSSARTNHLLSEKTVLVKWLENRLNKTNNYIKKTKDKLHALQHKKDYRQTADIIMANLHTIKEGADTVTLDDFYNGGQIEISLKPDMSPQKNAENLYRKAKNQSIEINTLTQNIKSKEEEWLQLTEEVEAFRISEDLPAIRKRLKSIQKNNAEAEKIVPYHKLIFMGHEIMVGKNARRNDDLTFGIAHKNDLWLHAKDTQGSHVVVRKVSNDNFPAPVIERAAELAAYYSKRKNENSCPVSYTLKKYVRKGKGMPPGAVFVDKEEVTLVTPRGL